MYNNQLPLYPLNTSQMLSLGVSRFREGTSLKLYSTGEEARGGAD